MRCNAGVATTNMIGDLPGYGTVWLYENGIANILSLFHVTEKGLHVQFDSEKENAFLLWKRDGTLRKFIPGPRGLYYCNTKQIEGTVLNIDNFNPDSVPTVN